MRLVVSAGGVPAGSYRAKLVGVEQIVNDQYGPGLRFSFAVSEGPHAGLRAWRTTGCVPTPANSLGKLLSGMLGRPLALDEELDTSGLIGREYLIVIVATERGTRVETAVQPASS